MRCGSSQRRGYNAGFMKRRLLTAFSVVSLAVCVGVCAIWIASHRRCLGFGRQAEHGAFDFEAWHGSIGVVIHTDYVEWLAPNEPRWYIKSSAQGVPTWTRNPNFSLFNFLGFSAGQFHLLDGPEETWLAAPCYSMVIAFGGVPLFHYRFRRTAAQISALGRCIACGYDLRATPERCPECGAVPAKGAGTMSAS